jgi:hypothetical protein
MLARVIIIAACVWLFSQPLSAQLQHPGGPCSIDEHSPETEQPAGDILAGRGADAHAATLRQIAIYLSIGNREGAEILTAQLRAMGVSAGVIAEAVTWEKLHSSSSAERFSDMPHRRPAEPVEAGWDASQ